MQNRGKDLEGGNKIMFEFCLRKIDSSPVFAGVTGVMLIHLMN